MTNLLAIAIPEGPQILTFLFAIGIPSVFAAALIRFVNQRSGETLDAHPLVVRAVGATHAERRSASRH